MNPNKPTYGDNGYVSIAILESNEMNFKAYKEIAGIISVTKSPFPLDI